MATRAQLMWSLWTLTAGRKPDRHWRLDEIPKLFLRRAGNLIEFGVGLEPVDRAGQRGVDNSYSLVDATELGLGLDLMQVGLPQGEVAEFVAHNRKTIRNFIDRIDTNAENRVLLWIFPQPAVSPVLESYEQFKPSLFHYVPQCSFTEEDEKKQLALFSVATRNRVVIDLGATKRNLDKYLAVAPVVRRGRR
jgi:hypothetical protein